MEKIDYPKELHFLFESSPNNECIAISIELTNDSLSFPIKSKNTTLYLMGKQMKKDLQNDECPEQEKGWMDAELLIYQLQKELYNDHIDDYYLDVMVMRWDKAFAKSPHASYLSSLIERRDGQIRFNHQNLTVKEYEED